MTGNGTERGQGEAALQVRGLSKSYGSLKAVRDLSFEAFRGEIIGFLGPNGAGKTTAIRMLSTILPPDAGSFTLGGVAHTDAIAIRQRIGVLPESAGYPFQQTGDEFISYHGRLFGHSPARAREIGASLLQEVGLGERASSRISSYSRGMRQRLGVARTLVNEPEVLFLDEPTLGLDPAGQRQMLRLISDIARQRQTTVILSTHFLDEVEQICSRVLILKQGEVAAEGSIADIKRQTAPRAARFSVPPEMHDEALAHLAKAAGIAHAAPANSEPGSIIATFENGWMTENSRLGMNSAIRALTDAEVPILSFELEGSRLSDAFLSLTEEEPQ